MTEPYSDPAWDEMRAENERLRTELDKAREWNRQMVEKAAEGGALDGYREMGARIAALEAERDRLREAGDKLSFAAQTTGGVAGRDEWLVAAIEGWQRARAALEGGSDG